MHLFGFIIRIHHDARSPERQIKTYLSLGKTSVYFGLSPEHVFLRLAFRPCEHLVTVRTAFRCVQPDAFKSRNKA